MRKVILILATMIGGLYANGQCLDASNVFSFTYENKQYEIVKEEKTWAEAATCAVQRGGKLVEIDDQAEQDTVWTSIINHANVPTNYTSVSNGGGIAYVWIGATDQDTEGDWIWDGDNDNNGNLFWTGEGANGAGNGAVANGAFNNWGGKNAGTPNEPDNFNGSQNYAAIGLEGWPSGTTNLGEPGEWNDIIGTSLIYYVIEHPEDVTGLESQANEAIKLYPNPATDIVRVNGEEIQQIEITDAVGRHVKTVETNSFSVSGLEPGNYTLKIKTLNSDVRKALIVQ